MQKSYEEVRREVGETLKLSPLYGEISSSDIAHTIDEIMVSLGYEPITQRSYLQILQDSHMK